MSCFLLILWLFEYRDEAKLGNILMSLLDGESDFELTQPFLRQMFCSFLEAVKEKYEEKFNEIIVLAMVGVPNGMPTIAVTPSKYG